MFGAETDPSGGNDKGNDGKAEGAHREPPQSLKEAEVEQAQMA